jgi:hypothetical protein
MTQKLSTSAYQFFLVAIAIRPTGQNLTANRSDFRAISCSSSDLTTGYAQGRKIKELESRYLTGLVPVTYSRRGFHERSTSTCATRNRQTYPGSFLVFALVGTFTR